MNCANEAYASTETNIVRHPALFSNKVHHGVSLVPIVASDTRQPEEHLAPIAPCLSRDSKEKYYVCISGFKTDRKGWGSAAISVWLSKINWQILQGCLINQDFDVPRTCEGVDSFLWAWHCLTVEGQVGWFHFVKRKRGRHDKSITQFSLTI